MLHKSLTVLHNINPSKLLNSLNSYNGIICPSLAIIKKDTFFNEFGVATLIFDESVIFNGKDRINKSDKESFVYLGDSWSARFPDIYYNHNNKGISKFENDFENELNLFKESVTTLISQYPNYEDTKRNLTRSPAVLYKFLNENGIKPEIPLSKPKFNADLTKSKELEDLINSLEGGVYDINYNLHKDIIDKLIDSSVKENNTIIEASRFDTIKETYTGINRKLTEALSQIKSGTPIMETKLGHELIVYGQYIHNKNNAEYDHFDSIREFREIIEKSNLNSKFQDYTEKINDTLFKDPKIMIGKRKFPINEENIIRYFKKEGTIGAEKTLTENVQKIRAAQLKRLYSISEINEAIDEIDYENAGFDYFDVNKCQNYIFSAINGEYSVWDIGDRINKIIMDKNFDNNDYLRDAFPDLDINDLTPKQLQDISDIRNSIYNQKVKYFEAKPMRNVYSHEIKKIVFQDDYQPSDTLKNLLNEKGISYDIIKSNDPNEYKKAININPSKQEQKPKPQKLKV